MSRVVLEPHCWAGSRLDHGRPDGRPSNIETSFSIHCLRFWGVCCLELSVSAESCDSGSQTQLLDGSLNKKLRFRLSDTAFSRQLQHSDTKIESDRKSIWSPEKGPVEIATDRI